MSACLFYLLRDEEPPLPLPLHSTTSVCWKETDKDKHLCQFRSGETPGGLKWKWQTLFPALFHLPFASYCPSWSCIWLHACRPGRCNSDAPEGLCCIVPAGPGPGRIGDGKQRTFQRKAPTKSLWEESQAQIYVCGPKLEFPFKCCKSNICQVSTLHPCYTAG